VRSRDLFTTSKDLFVNSRDLLVIFDPTDGIDINNHLLLPINSPLWGGGGDFWPFALLLNWLPLFSLYLISRLFRGKTPTLPLVTICEKILSCTSAFHSQAGRLVVTNAIFTALAMYLMSTFSLHKTIIKQIDKYVKHCFGEILTLMLKILLRQHGN